MRLLATTLILMAAGCGGGDLCDADLSTVAGTWQLSFSDGAGSPDVATVVIDESGDVSVTSSASDAWSCQLDRDALCDLQISCTESGGGSSFSFSLQKK